MAGPAFADGGAGERLIIDLERRERLAGPAPIFEPEVDLAKVAPGRRFAHKLGGPRLIGSDPEIERVDEKLAAGSKQRLHAA